MGNESLAGREGVGWLLRGGDGHLEEEVAAIAHFGILVEELRNTIDKGKLLPEFARYKGGAYANSGLEHHRGLHYVKGSDVLPVLPG